MDLPIHKSLQPICTVSLNSLGTSLRSREAAEAEKFPKINYGSPSTCGAGKMGKCFQGRWL